MSRNPGRLGLGIVVGSLFAVGAAVAQRELMRRAGTRLLDWDAVREIARRRLGEHAAPLPRAERERAEAFYRAELLRIEPVVAAEIGATLPRALEVPAVVDRLEWIDLNIETFRHLFGRVERLILEQQVGPDTAGRAISRLVNRQIGNQQLGLLLSFLSRKVLGQYDVSLLAASPAVRGRLYFVEQNIVATASMLRIPLREFRTFIALHEATHAFEFEAYPWLRQHFADLVSESVERFASDSGGMVGRLRQALAGGEGHWLERMMTDEQLQTFQRTQALMSLLEGYSNHVMNAAGRRLISDFDTVHDRFERRNERRGPLERAFLRLTGLDLKMEQYLAGERFVDAVIASRGRDYLNRVWTGPGMLPTLEEIRQPERWVARIDRGSAA
jgi:coenzyme F420 biosynthesis associated uncharacterized protein